MVTLLVFGFYLPMGLIPAVLPSRVIQQIKPSFRWLSVIPSALTLILIVFFEPLAAILSYAIALPPVLISAFSLTIAVIGVRLVRQAAREGERTRGLIVATVLSALPFLVVSPYLGYALVSIFVNVLSA